MKDILIRVAMIIAACAFACALVMLLVAILVHIDQHIFRERAERLRNDIVGITPRQTTLDSEDTMLSSWTDSVTRSTPCDKNFCDIHIVVERPFTDAVQALLVASLPRGLRVFKFLGGRPASADGRIYVRNGYVWGTSFSLTSYVYAKPGDAHWPDGWPWWPQMFHSVIAPPAAGPWFDEIDRNLFWTEHGEFQAVVDQLRSEDGKRNARRYNFAEWQALGWDKNSAFADPVFVDPEHLDFRVEANSPALQLGFANFEMGTWGLTKDFPRLWLKSGIAPDGRSEE